MIKSRVDEVLKKYFNNYDEDNLNVGILSGEVSLKNLDCNITEINREFDVMDLPIKLKYGSVTNLHISISIFKLQLEQIEMENLILVIEPHPDNMSTIDEAYSEDMITKYIVHLINNLKNLKKGVKLARLPDNVLTSKMKSLFNAGKLGYDDPSPNSNSNTNNSEAPNLIGEELFDLIFGRLYFNIKVKNLKIYFEFDKDKRPNLNFMDTYSLLVQLKEMSINSVKFMGVNLE